MKYDTHIFRPSEKKKRDELLYLLYILIGGLIIFTFYLLHVPSVGVLTGAGTAFTLFKLKLEDDRRKGVKRFGHLIDKISISTTAIVFGGLELSINDLTELEISATDFAGIQKGLFGISYGTDNNIKFKFKEKHYSFQFQIRSQNDLKYMHQIINLIEKQKSK